MKSKFNISEQTQNFIMQNIDVDSHLLALKAKKYSDVEINFALEQINSRRQAKEKLPNIYANTKLIFPPSVSMEQCSSEATAAYKAELCGEEKLLDITGGFGVDFLYMSKKFKHAVYVEKNEYLAEIAKHNFDILEIKNAEVLNCDSSLILDNSEKFDCIYIDPSRRANDNSRKILLEDCSPNILEIKDLLLQKSKKVIIKLSPIFDITELMRKFDCKRIHIVAVKNECKELLVELEQNCSENLKIVCVNITNKGRQIFEFICEDEKNLEYNFVPFPQKYLYEPNAAVQKSGGFKSVATKFNLNALNANSKIYTSDVFVDDFCGRIFTVEKVFSFNKKELKTNLENIKKANISVRNFPLSVADLRKKLNIAEGGDIYLFATTLFDNSKVIIQCSKS